MRGARWLIAISAAALAVPLGLAARAVDASTVPMPSALAVGRLQYDGGGDWYANPSSLPNLIAAIRTRSTIPVASTELRVRLTDPQLWDVGFLHATGHGTLRFSDDEIGRLREWLGRGGFLHLDDNYGMDESVRRELARVFPDRPLVRVPRDHPIYRAVYTLPEGLPKIHEHDGKPPEGLGIFIGERLAVFYSYESDLGNGWEDPGTHPNDPPEKHEAALQMGVNLFVYAVTSRPVS
jgi:hypothetical protein